MLYLLRGETLTSEEAAILELLQIEDEYIRAERIRQYCKELRGKDNNLIEQPDERIVEAEILDEKTEILDEKTEEISKGTAIQQELVIDEDAEYYAKLATREAIRERIAREENQKILMLSSSSVGENGKS